MPDIWCHMTRFLRRPNIGLLTTDSEPTRDQSNNTTEVQHGKPMSSLGLPSSVGEGLQTGAGMNQKQLHHQSLSIAHKSWNFGALFTICRQFDKSENFFQQLDWSESLSAVITVYVTIERKGLFYLVSFRNFLRLVNY